MSEFMKLNGQDFIKGIIVAGLVAVLGSLQTILEAGALPTGAEWITISKMAGAAIISYLLKNLFTNSQGQIAKAE
jgi:hypothetical protein